MNREVLTMKPNLDQLLDEAGVPTAEEVLLEELEHEKKRSGSLEDALRKTRGKLKEVQIELNQRRREDKKRNKSQYRNKKKYQKFNG
jgi:hypothetical protein